MTIIEPQELDAAPAPPEPVPSPPVEAATSPRRVVSKASKAGQAFTALGLASVGFAVLIGIWSLIVLRSPDLPTPGETWTSLRHLVGDPFSDKGPNDKGIALQLGATLGRVFKGFGLAILVGVPLGFLIGGSKRAWQAANPVLQILRPVSPLAWFPIGLVVLKSVTGAAVFVIFITSLWPTLLNTAAGAASVPQDHRNVARVFKFGKLAYLRHVMAPHSLPSIVTGLRLSMGVAWMVIVAAEMLSGGTGIGSFVWESYNGSKYPQMVATLIVIGVVGLVLDTVFLRLGRRVAVEEVRP